MCDTDYKPKMLIMTPGLLPVPAVRGGAVEKLITDIIDENEKRQILDITIVSVADKEIQETKYSHTHIIQVKQTGFCRLCDRITDKVLRTVHADNSFSLFDMKMLKAVAERTDPAEFDMAVAENMAGTAAKLFKRLTKSGIRVPVFFHVHNNIDMYRSPELIKRLSDNGVEFIAVSEYIRNEILGVAPKAKTTVLLNGLDVKVMDIRLKQDRFILRKKYGIPQNVAVVLYSGRIIAEKGVYELVRGFVLHKRSHPESDLFLVMCGDSCGADGKNTGYGESVSKELEAIPEHYRSLGRISYESMAEVYALADILVVPTIDNEPFGMVVLEGMSMGLPIITTASGGIPEVLEDDKGSIKLPGKNIAHEIAGVLDEISDGQGKSKLNEMGSHNHDVFMRKDGVLKKDYFDRFLTAVGINNK